MIDLHSHILFNVDDGPRNLEDSIKLLEHAANEGITDIVSTSHANHPQFHVSSSTVKEQIQILQQEVNNRQIPITIHPGHEVRLSEKAAEKCLSNEIFRLANSNYLLIELPFNTIPLYTNHIIHELLRHNITPIIAHPERNKAIAEKPEILARLIREGAAAQLTAGSLAGHFGRAIQQLSLDLIRANLVHTYGSDVHNETTKPFLFHKGLKVLEKKKELDAIDVFLENNRRVLCNEPLIMSEPEELSKRKWWKIL